MSPEELRTALGRHLQRDRWTLIAMLVVYPAMVVWSAFAVGPRGGPALMVPAAVLAGAWVWMRVRRRMRETERVLASGADLRPTYAVQLEKQIAAKRSLRWAAPALVFLSLGGAALVVGRHGNATYWIGALAVGVFLIGASVHAHVSLQLDVARRASLQ